MTEAVKIQALLNKDHRHEVSVAAWVGLIVNIVISVLKIAAGLIGNSQAVVADGFHSASDLTTDIAIIVGVKFWTKPADECHPHGHYRLETLITVLIGIILALAGAALLLNAIRTIHQSHSSPPGWIALSAAMLSIITKEALYQWTKRIGHRIKSIPLIANAWHHRSDALSSIPVVLAVSGAMFMPAWNFLDHVGAVIVSLFIFQAAFKITWPSLLKLTDQGADSETVQRIQLLVRNTPGVLDLHKIRTRFIGCADIAVDLHIQVQEDLTVRQGHDIAETVKLKLLNEDPDVADVVVHVEPFE